MEYLEAEMAVRAKETKLLARKKRSHHNILILLCFLVAFGAMVIWGLVAPDASPKSGIKFALAIGIAFAISELLLKFRRSTQPPCDAKCPACSYSWEIKEGRAVPLSEQMETWDRCPGCGLLMGDEIIDLSIQKDLNKSNIV